MLPNNSCKVYLSGAMQLTCAYQVKSVISRQNKRVLKMMSEISSAVKNAIENFIVPKDVGFGTLISPVMIEANFKDNQWSDLQILPYGDITIPPTAKVFHYAQEIFEGLKAYKSPNGEALLFRPEQNAKRFNYSAKRMAMPETPEEMFLTACKTITMLSKRFIPEASGSSLYIRPFMFATEATLGIKPSSEFKFMVLASPSGSYFKAGGLNVFIERSAIRACPGGVGTAKTGGNYAASLLSSTKAIDHGCQQTLWLDAINHQKIEEMSGMNFMCIKNNKIITPELTDTILSGITRASVIELAKTEGYEVIERTIEIDELIDGVKSGEITEAFACGTAAIITPIEKFIEENGISYELPKLDTPISLKLRSHLLDIQEGRKEGPAGWSQIVD